MCVETSLLYKDIELTLAALTILALAPPNYRLVSSKRLPRRNSSRWSEKDSPSLFWALQLHDLKSTSIIIKSEAKHQ